MKLLRLFLIRFFKRSSQRHLWVLSYSDFANVYFFIYFFTVYSCQSGIEMLWQRRKNNKTERRIPSKTTSLPAPLIKSTNGDVFQKFYHLMRNVSSPKKCVFHGPKLPCIYIVKLALLLKRVCVKKTGSNHWTILEPLENKSIMVDVSRNRKTKIGQSIYGRDQIISGCYSIRSDVL